MKRQFQTIIRHPSLSPDDDSVVQFQRLLAEGYAQRSKRQSLDLHLESEQLCETLLKRLMSKARSVITSEAIEQIQGMASPEDRRKLAGNIRDQLSKFIYEDLVVCSGLPGRGRQPILASRDRRIFAERRKGNSWGTIAKALGISRHAVQAAHRRELHRRVLVCRDYPSLKSFLGRIGMILEERPQGIRKKR